MSSILTQRIKDYFNWRHYVERNYATKYTQSSELRICCPNCGESDFKCYVNTTKGVFNCFKCDFSSRSFDIFDFVAITEGIPRNVAFNRLVQECVELAPKDLREALSRKLDVPDQPAVRPFEVAALAGLPEGVKPLRLDDEEGKPYLDYLLERGLTPFEITEVLDLHYGSHEPIRGSGGRNRGSLTNRFLYPIYGGPHNDLVSWQARTIEPNNKVKYLAAPKSDLSKTFWPFVPPYKNTAVITEGVFDAISVRRVPGVSAYASFSKKISKDQMRVLMSWDVEEIIVFWDNDAKNDIKAAIPDLKMRFDKVKIASTPKDVKDPGDLLRDASGPSILKMCLSNAVDTSGPEFTKWLIT